MLTFKPILHQLTLFDYNEMRPRGIPRELRQQLVTMANVGKAHWKAGDMRKATQTMTNILDKLQAHESRINQKRNSKK